MASALGSRHHEFASAIALEAGKPWNDAAGEVYRAIDTVRP